MFLAGSPSIVTDLIKTMQSFFTEHLQPRNPEPTLKYKIKQLYESPLKPNKIQIQHTPKNWP